MGKKHIIQKTEKELIAENENMEATVKKEASASAPLAGQIKEGRIYISSSYNNTVMTLTDARGNVLAWALGDL
jgi:ribosomal protein S11